MNHELFVAHNREIGKNFDAIMSRAFRMESKSITTVGFKLFYYHLTDGEWTKFLSFKDILIIHLTRRNRLRTIVSLDIAFKTDQWSSRDRRKKVPRNALSSMLPRSSAGWKKSSTRNR